MAPRKKKEIVTEEIKIEEKAVEQPKIKAEAKEKKSKKYIKVKVPGLNVRKEPSLSSEIISVGQFGDKFELRFEETNKGFYEILLNGKSAFVMADFVE